MRIFSNNYHSNDSASYSFLVQVLKTEEYTGGFSRSKSPVLVKDKKSIYFGILSMRKQDKVCCFQELRFTSASPNRSQQIRGHSTQEQTHQLNSANAGEKSLKQEKIKAKN